jgi:hypothetical protein
VNLNCLNMHHNEPDHRAMLAIHVFDFGAFSAVFCCTLLAVLQFLKADNHSTAWKELAM